MGPAYLASCIANCFSTHSPRPCHLVSFQFLGTQRNDLSWAFAPGIFSASLCTARLSSLSVSAIFTVWPSHLYLPPTPPRSSFPGVQYSVGHFCMWNTSSPPPPCKLPCGRHPSALLTTVPSAFNKRCGIFLALKKYF